MSTTTLIECCNCGKVMQQIFIKTIIEADGKVTELQLCAECYTKICTIEKCIQPSTTIMFKNYRPESEIIFTKKDDTVNANTKTKNETIRYNEVKK